MDGMDDMDWMDDRRNGHEASLRCRVHFVHHVHSVHPIDAGTVPGTLAQVPGFTQPAFS